MNGMEWKPLKGGCPKEIPYRGGAGFRQWLE